MGSLGELGGWGGWDTQRRRVFVSYHHDNDRSAYQTFCSVFCDTHDVVEDRSVRGAVGSDDAEYVRRRIREDYINGTSCTIVLCGEQTFGRRFVDWEIKATLDAGHGLLGVALPTCARDWFGSPLLPNRLVDDLRSGHAVMVDWSTLAAQPSTLATHVSLACDRSRQLIDNDRPMRSRSA